MVIASESPFLQEATVRVFPALANAGQRSTICGPESFTPDKQPLFGEVPGVGGLLVNCAMNSRGVQFCGGVGRQMADLVVDGAPSLDMFAYDIARLVLC